MRRVLVLKGGGVRGILQLDALRILEKHFKKPLHELFDLICGTSVGSITGGIISLGILPMEEIIDSFLRYFPIIFHKKRFTPIFGPLYKRKNFDLMWKSIIGQKEYQMKDCKTKFMCTAINLCDNKTHFFKSWKQNDENEFIRETIAKSFAAPFYFGEYVDEKNKAVWVDGGAGDTNNPLDRAYAEIINQGWYKERTEIIAIGTGTADLSIPYEKAKKMKQFKQIWTFMNPMEGGLARIQSSINKIEQMEILAKANPLVTFKNFDVDIGKKYSGIDKVKYIQEYLSFGRIIAEKVQKDLKEWKIPYY